MEIAKFKEQLKELYKKLKDDCNAEKSIVPFIFRAGKNFPKEKNNGILFYGRATNGWSGSWKIDELFNEENSNRGWFPNDALTWVDNQAGDENYNTNRSQFWQLIKGITIGYYKQDSWSYYVMWSNVCKAVPQKKGNPSKKLYNKTLETNCKIMKAEIDYFSPKFVVLFTGGGDWISEGDSSRGGDWSSDFLKYLKNGDDIKENLKEDCQWDGDDRKAKLYKIGDVYYIVTLHPQGKKIQPHVDCIINLIKKYDDNNNENAQTIDL